MESKSAAQWAFLFEKFGKGQLRKMLFKAAIEKEEKDRIVIEFRDDKAMEITEHVEELESDLEP